MSNQTDSGMTRAESRAIAIEVTESLRNETISDEEGAEVARQTAEANQRMSEED